MESYKVLLHPDVLAINQLIVENKGFENITKTLMFTRHELIKHLEAN